MKKFFFILLIPVLLPFIGGAQGVCNVCDSVNIYDTSLTLVDIMDFLEPYANDTGEGQSKSYLKYLNHTWGPRVTKNDANANFGANINMFSQYHSTLREDMTSQQTQNCGGSTGFHGNWELIGPKSLPLQAMGKVDALWVHPTDSNYILAGGMGGLFRTTNGGTEWKCITDGAAITNGIVGITSICVDPTNGNNIYLGTSGEEYKLININSLGLPRWMAAGAAILKSSDGGQTWTQETVGGSGFPYDIERVQRVYITPDGTRLYAFGNAKVYTRLKNNTTWQEITPPVMTTWANQTPAIPILEVFEWLDLEFVPGDQNHFFISGNFVNPNGAPISMIWESDEAVPASGDWNEISLINNTLSYNIGGTTFTEGDFCNFLLSIPEADTLFVLALPYAKSGINAESSTAVLKYNISGSTRQWTHLGTLPTYELANQYKLGFEVSNAANSSNNNCKVIYAATSNNYVSWDNGETYTEIGNYHPSSTANTHGDIRDIVLFKATNTSRGRNDIVFFATDGGVAKKSSGFDPQVMGQSTTININGIGLACGTFWGFSTSEHGGIGYGGQMHNGKQAYEPASNPKWLRTTSEDAYRTIFDRADRTRAYGVAGFGTYDRHATSSGSGRLINSQVGSNTHPSDNDYSLNFEMPLAADNANNQYHGIKEVWEGVVTNPTSISWSSVGRNLPDEQSSQGVRAIALSDYEYLRGYVLFNHAWNGNSVDQWFGYRNPAVNNGDFLRIQNVPGMTTYPLTDVTLDPRSPNRVWVSLGGINWSDENNQAHNRVKYSPNSGSTWYAVDKGLPIHMPVTDIIYQEGSNIVYCATDVGIFVADFNTFDAGDAPNYGIEWQCFSKGVDGGPDFPFVYVTQLNINYCQGKLYASTYGRSIWGTDLYTKNSRTTPTEIISSNTTWSSTKYIHSGIRVTNNATLTIQNTAPDQTTIYMPKNGNIIVEPGAKLVVNGARITNGCVDCMWDGIRVVGAYNQPQTAGYQGVVELNNATIEHAKVAIGTYNTTGLPHFSTGGIIKAENTQFLNNATSVSIEPYTDRTGSPFLKNYKAEFTSCTFEVDDDFKGGTDNRFMAHVNLRQVSGVYIWGSNFINSATNAMKGEGDGIRTHSAGFLLRAWCDPFIYPCTDVRNQFSGLRTGVYMGLDITGRLTSCEIDKSDFNSCSVGIFSEGQHHFVATRNYFAIGYGKTTDLDNFDCDKNIGIWTRNAWSPVIEDNSFEGFTHGGQVPSHQNIGTVTDNSSENNNRIYKNTFQDLHRASIARGRNSDGIVSAYGAQNGLRYLCNTYDDNNYDIQVMDLGPVTTHQAHTIAYTQGSSSQSTGNLFLDRGSFYHLQDISTWGGFIYYHTAGNYTPQIPAGTKVWPVFTVAGNTCVSLYSPVSGDVTFPLSTSTLNDVKASYNNAATSRLVLIGDLNGQLDGGNTVDLLNYINTSMMADSPTVRTTLLAHSPFLSKEVLMATASASILPQVVLMEVLEANPDVLKDEELLDYLMSTPMPLTEPDIETLRLAANNSTARTEMIADIGQYSAEMGSASALILNHYLLDTVTTERDSIPVWLDHVNTLEAEYSKVAFYTSLGDYTTASSLISNISTKFSLSTEQLQELDLYQELWTLMKDVYEDGRTARELTEGELTQLETIGDNPIATGRLIGTQVGVISNEPTHNFRIPCNIEFDIVEGKPGRRNNVAVNSVVNSTDNRVKAYPNPAKDFVVFEYDIKKSSGKLSIQVSNVTGQKIAEIKLDGLRGTSKWDIRSLPAGVYIYELREGGKSIQVERLVIAK